MIQNDAVSEIIAAILLIAVVTVTMGIVAVLLTSNISPTKVPHMDFEACNDSNTIYVYHTGGDPVEPDDFAGSVTFRFLNAEKKEIIKQSLTERWTSGNVLNFSRIESAKYLQLIANTGEVDNLIEWVEIQSCSGTGPAPTSTSTTSPTPTETTSPTPTSTTSPTPTETTSPTPTSTQDPECWVSPHISVNPSKSGDAPFTVVLTDVSDHYGGYINSWSWNFGDGSTSSTEGPHTITYSNPGSYTVTLTVSNGCDTGTTEETITVCTAPDAIFTVDPTSGYSPLEVTFTDSSTGTISSYEWDFGDGSDPVSGQGPHSHTYSTEGTFTAELTVTGPCGSDTTTQDIKVEDCIVPEAIFTADPTSGYAPLDVTFTNSSTGTISSYEWDFGDGSDPVSGQGPHSHTYSTEGTFTAELTVTGPCGSDTTTQDIKVEDCIVPEAIFTADPTSGYSPLEVTFTDSSTGTIISYEWDFGDGSDPVSGQGPHSHTYSTEGTFTAELTVTGLCGSDTATHEVKVLSCTAPDAIFTADPTSGYSPLEVTFTDSSTGTISSYEWDFGDGTTGSGQGPHSHTYSTEGTFAAELTVTGPCGSDTTTQDIEVGCPPPVASFTEEIQGSRWVKFTDTSSGGTISSWDWDFGDGDTSSEQNPRHRYSQNGEYSVTLTVTGPCGSDSKTHLIRTRCDYIAGKVTITGGSLSPEDLTVIADGYSYYDYDTEPEADGTYLILIERTGTYSVYIDDCPGSGCPSYTINPEQHSGIIIDTNGNNCLANDIDFELTYVCTPPVASFSAEPTSGTAPLSVEFTDTSTGSVEEIEWDFGDGTTGSGSPVTHEYEMPGTYSTTMTISGDCGSDTASETIQVTRGPGFSVYGWLRFTQAPSPPASDERWATLVLDGNTDSNRRYHLLHNQQNTQFEMFFRTVNGANGYEHASVSFGPVQGVSYLLVAVYDQTDGIGRLYVNGVEAASHTYDTSGIAPSPNLYQVGGPSGIYFGGSANQRRLQGDVGGVNNLDNVLLGPEIQTMYEDGPPW